MEPSENPTESEEPSENPTVSEEPTESPTESLEPTESVPPQTIAGIICDEENAALFSKFCAIIRTVGLDFILNDFEELDDGEVLIQNGPVLGLAVNNNRALLSASEHKDRSLSLPNIDFDDFSDFMALNFGINDISITGFEAFIADFKNRLDINRVFTVFAFTNTAFESMNIDVKGFLDNASTVEYYELLLEISEYQIIAGEAMTYNSLRCGEMNKMSSGESSLTECTGLVDKFQIGHGNTEATGPCKLDPTEECKENYPTINLQYRNIVASNGYIHVVNNIILPEVFNNISNSPSTSPSLSPTKSQAPTISSFPSASPTVSSIPSSDPSQSPSDVPSDVPSVTPSDVPSDVPSENPTRSPS